MVYFGGMLVNRGSGLSAKVAVPCVEVESTDVVSAMGAGEPHASFYAGNGVETLHSFSLVFLCAIQRHEG